MNCNSQLLSTSITNSFQSTPGELYNNNTNESSINMSTTASTSSLTSTSTSQLTTVDDVKSRLEDVILGQGSARSELMRRKGKLNNVHLSGK